MNRRDALQRLAALTLVPAVPDLTRLGVATGRSKAATPRIGLALYTVRNIAAKDGRGTLRAVAEIGYRDLDMYPDVAKLPPKETRELLDSLNLVCRSARCTVDVLRGNFDQMIETTKILGAPVITLSSTSIHDGGTMSDLENLIALYNRAGAAARSAGLGFAIHNHDAEYHPVDGKIPMDLIMSSTDADAVKMQMDVYWITKGGRNAVSEIHRLGKRIASLHLKDMDATPNRGITTVGRGIIDFGAILKAASEVGITDTFVEEDSPKDEMASARDAWAHLSRLSP